ncbi:MAG: outer membrane protein assembly factor BamA [Bryobacteraceae bacterium]
MVCFFCFLTTAATLPGAPRSVDNPQPEFPSALAQQSPEQKQQTSPPSPQPSPEPAQPAPQAKPAEQKKANPFETVPVTPEEQAPKPPQAPGAKPQLEGPKPATEQPASNQNVIEAIEFRGARRVPQDTLRALIFSKKGDRYDEDAIQRDFMALWNTGRFDDISVEREAGRAGWILRFVVTERRVVRSIKYDGNKSLTVSEILDRFKERRVGLTVESQFDQNKVQRATVVLKEYLAERGRQYATVTPEIRQIPPSSLEITFKMVEGPKVKVGIIDITGNQMFTDRVIKRAMKNLKPIGIPRSIFFEDLFAKTYDSTKLEEDKERIRQFYMDHGYFTARIGEQTVTIRRTGGGGIKLPIFYSNRPGIKADIAIPVEEGKKYQLGKINFIGVKLFRTPETLMRPVFQMAEGDAFSTAKLRKGLEELRKLYGNFGYIDMVPEPDFAPNPQTAKLDLTLTVDEGKQFFVRRIDFSGNTTTRDKVIRRELLIDEGDIFNTRLWQVSILRLNQLGYFEALKEEESAQITRDTRNNVVDILLKVKERGKNSVSLNGGVSGISGSFIGFGYSTNNFLGLGETLSLNSELGDRIRNATFGFTEPYFLGRPMQAGFTIYTQRFNYDQGREVSLLSGRNLIPYYNSLGQQNLLNYVSNGYGFTTFLSYPLKRSFARMGITYGYDRQNITTLTTASSTYFDYINFQGLAGANQLTGVKTSKLSPSYTYNSVDHPITPSRGHSIFVSMGYAGGPLGGNVNLLEPTASATWFRKGLKKGHVIGMRGLGRFLTGYGGKVAPPFNRIYMGGENDVRGFDIWSISPIAYVPSQATINVLNDDYSARQQYIIVNGRKTLSPVTQTIPVYQLIFPGGDTQILGNFEYRIPIFGPVTIAAFFDGGFNKVMRSEQLQLNQDRLDNLNGQFPQASFGKNAIVAAGTEKVRTSTGLELQIMMPVVNAPFRLYWAYNPTVVQEYLAPPIVADRSLFPNNATFLNSIASFGQATPYFERRKVFRFTISRTF